MLACFLTLESWLSHTGNRLVERSLGHLARLIRRIEDLVVEDREVQGKTETDGVCWCELSAGDLGGSLVCLEGLVRGLLALVGGRELGQVTVVVTLPAIEKRSDIALDVV